MNANLFSDFSMQMLKDSNFFLEKIKSLYPISLVSLSKNYDIRKSCAYLHLFLKLSSLLGFPSLSFYFFIGTLSSATLSTSSESSS